MTKPHKKDSEKLSQEVKTYFTVRDLRTVEAGAKATRKALSQFVRDAAIEKALGSVNHTKHTPLDKARETV